MRDDLPREDVLATIDRFVQELLHTAGVLVPPVDAITLARRYLGMSICLDRSQRQRGRAQRSAGQRHIFLRPEPTEERHQWTVAHEIGEHLKPALLERMEIPPAEMPVMMGESLANLFAYHLLVPDCWFRTDVSEADHDLLRLKKRYSSASHEVIAWRLLDLPDPCIITIVDNDHVQRRRSNAWPIHRALEPAEQECQRYVHYYSRQRVVQTDGWTVHGWPVHQADWKREILRSVLEVEI